MRVKVCGMTSVEEVEAIATAGASFAGFIFYSKSPRYAFRQLSMKEIKRIQSINKVGVFVNADFQDIMHIVDECRLQMVQLHGDESPKFCERIADYISVIKAIRVQPDDNVDWRISPYQEVCDHFLFDTAGAGYGGTGKKFDWSTLNRAEVNKPYFLSGGIQPNDIDLLTNYMQQPVAKNLFSFDINSGFELAPGVKNIPVVSSFIQQVQPITYSK
ncbi:MAG: phosphoribosylanthranilate isomerase [Hydrotalea sp.]|nr:phosphoribosylanthranilate isomerase [Hydrotalea sp.]